MIVLRRQVDRIKTELINRLKAEGVSYEERMNRLDEVTHPQPLADYIHAAFDHFLRDHPFLPDSSSNTPFSAAFLALSR